MDFILYFCKFWIKNLLKQRCVKNCLPVWAKCHNTWTSSDIRTFSWGGTRCRCLRRSWFSFLFFTLVAFIIPCFPFSHFYPKLNEFASNSKFWSEKSERSGSRWPKTREISLFITPFILINIWNQVENFRFHVIFFIWQLVNLYKKVFIFVNRM